MMNVPEIIAKKRDNLEWSSEDVEFFVKSVTNRDIQESQIGAMLMAIYLNGMTVKETVELTKCMTSSGERLIFPEEWEPLLVDKHSTGGIGDKISLILAPTLAALGFKVPMISGRGLGITGGTLDKLESIPGFKTKLTNLEMTECLKQAGCFIAGATEAIAPADAILYQQRDITNTVASRPLIVSSILSKKFAEGARALVMDIKVGKATFLKTFENALATAELMVDISKGLGVETKCVLSQMDCPIGYAIGNAVEVEESLKCLCGDIPDDILSLVTTLGGALLETKGRVKNMEEGKAAVANVISNGLALKHFEKMLISQGVDDTTARRLCNGDYKDILSNAPFQTVVYAKSTGYVVDVNALDLGQVCWKLGAGRTKASDPIDHSVGLILFTKPGKLIEKGHPWVTILHSEKNVPAHLIAQVQNAITIQDQCPILPALILKIL